MSEKDPREYRGGAHEPSDAKGGDESWADNEGVVPREMVDDPGEPAPERADDPQALSDRSLGGVTDRDPQDDSIDPHGGDDADATAYGGTGGNVEETKEELEEGRPVSWVQGADAAPADSGS